MENPILLTFGHWPTEAPLRNFSVSPTTLRVVKNVKLNFDSLLPISYAEFVLENNLMNASKSQSEQMYQRQVDRRRKKVEILQDIWVKVKQKRSRSAKYSLSAKSSCMVVKKDKPIKRCTSKSFHKENPRTKSKSPLIFKAKSPKKDSTYFDYYNTNNQIKVCKKKSYEQESTQSRRQRTNGSSRNNDEYFNGSWGKKMQQHKSPVHIKENTLNFMTQMLQKQSQMDSKHMQELEQFSDLTQIQKRRLLKIHQIEKQKLRKQIESMKVNIVSHKKLTKGFAI